MNTAEKLHNDIDFIDLTYHYYGRSNEVNFDNFSDAATLFVEIKSSKIKLDDEKKIK